MVKRITAMVLTLVLVLGLAACNTNPAPATTTASGSTTAASGSTTAASGSTTAAPSNTAEKKELVYGQVNMKAILDRTIITYIETGQICEQIFEGLLYNNPFTGEMQPCLAEGFATISADNLTYTFKLKQGVKWHDGTDFTADDVLYTFERIFTPATGSLVVEDYQMIVGAQEMLDGTATTLSGIEVIDPYTIKVTITEPFALFEPFFGTCPIYPRKGCTEAGADWGLGTAIGTGPFALQEHTMDIGARLVRNDNYHDQNRMPTIDSIYFKFYSDLNTMLLEYEAGNIDSLILDGGMVEQYQDDPTFASHLNSHPTFGHYFLVMNFNMDPWKDNPKAREAFSYAVDTDSICNDLFNGMYQPAAGLLTPSVMGHDSSLQPKKYDPEKAKALLAEAGYPGGVDIVMTTTSLESVGGKMIVAIQASAAAAGFNISINEVDRAVWTDIRNNGKVETFVASWFLGLSEADGIVYGFFHSGNNKFFSVMYVNEEYDNLVSQARSTLDVAARTELYRQADKHLLDNFVTVPVAWPVQFYLTQPWLQNFQTENYVPNFEHCDIDTALQPDR